MNVNSEYTRCKKRYKKTEKSIPLLAKKYNTWQKKLRQKKMHQKEKN